MKFLFMSLMAVSWTNVPVGSFTPVLLTPTPTTATLRRGQTRAHPPTTRLYLQPENKNSNVAVTNRTEEASSAAMDSLSSSTMVEKQPLAPSSKPEQQLQPTNGAATTTESEQEVTPPVIRIPSYKKFLLFDEVKGRFYESNVDQETIPFATLFERTLDTVEDVVVHARRIPYDKGWIEYKPSKKLQTVVLLGSGWGAHALMKVADTYKIRLIVVSPTNHFVFTPMLASAAVGTVEYRSMTEAVRASNPMIDNYIEGRAIDIDIERKVIKVKLEELLESTREGRSPITELAYDKLVVAVGCKVADTIVPGAAEYAMKLKSCDDSRMLRNAIGECLEYASRPDVAPQNDLAENEALLRQEIRRKRLRFCIVGGGPTGVELAGELSDFFVDCTRDRIGPFQKLKEDISIVLVHGGSDLVPQFEPELRDHALRTLREQGVEVRLNTYVKRVGDGFIQLQEKGGGEIETLDVGLTVWAAGIAPVPFVETLLSKLPPEARGVGGRIKVDHWLRCPTPTPETFGSIIVLGDAAGFELEDKTYLPQTAQVAGQQGAFVARMLDRGYDYSATPPRVQEPSDVSAWLKVRGIEEAPGFRFLNLGILAYVGKGEALSQVQLGDAPIFSYAGSISFVLWRSVYLVKQVATRNRILVLFDWFKCKLFGRDITRL